MAVAVRTVGTPQVAETSSPGMSTPAGQSGDLLVLALICDNDTTDSLLTTPSGCTLHYTSAINYLPRCRVFSIPYDDAAASYSWAINGAHQSASVPLVLSGVDLSGTAANRITGASTAAGSTGSSTTAVAATTTGASGGLLLTLGAALRYNAADAGGWWTITGFTEHVDTALSWQKAFVASKAISADGATGSTTATAAVSMASGWTAGQVAFRPGAAAPAGPEGGRFFFAGV